MAATQPRRQSAILLLAIALRWLTLPVRLTAHVGAMTRVAIDFTVVASILLVVWTYAGWW